MVAILRGQTVGLAECVPHPRNYNMHAAAQVQALQESLRIFGQIPAIVVQAGPQAEWGVGAAQCLVVQGHGLLLAARALGELGLAPYLEEANDGERI